MAAVLMLLRARLRRRLRAWLALTLLAGLAGGVALTAAAGARRTDTAYPRFLAASHSDDLLVSSDTSILPALGRLPEVEQSGLMVGYALLHVDSTGHLGEDPQRPLSAASDNLLHTMDVPALVAGRMADVHREDEVVVNTALADLWHLHPGSRVTLRAFTQEDQQQVTDPSKPIPPTAGRRETFTVTGIVVSADDVIPDPRQPITRVFLTPAYTRAHAATEGAYAGLGVRLRHGAADLAAYEADANRLAAQLTAKAASGEGGSGGLKVLFNPRADTDARIQQAIQPEVVALWLFAGLVALTALLILGQAISRQLAVEGDDDPTLRALGMAPWQLAVASLARVGLSAVVASAVAVLVAVVASPLMPIGPVRAVEPQPGISVDGAVLGIGAGAMVVLLLLRAAFPAWRMAQRSAPAAAGQGGGAGRSSRLAAGVAQLGLPASTVVGVRLALEPGRGRTAVPVRSSAAGAALAVAAVVASLTFAASLDHLVGTPRLFGWDWDLQVDNGFNAVTAQQAQQMLGSDPDVAAFAGGSYGSVHVDGVEVPAVGMLPLRGAVSATVAEGRAPARDDEIVLGGATLDRLHRSVGDTVAVAGEGRPARRMRIVGRAVFPVLGIGDFAPTSLGEGAELTTAGLDAAGGSAISAPDGGDSGSAPQGAGGPSSTPSGDSASTAASGSPTSPPQAAGGPGSAPPGPGQLVSFVVLRWAPGVDAAAAQRRIAAQLPAPPVGPELRAVIRPTEIATYGRITSTPLLLAGILGVLGVGALAHALISAVRRRARDLAVLKTLGFVRRQVWLAVAWQATTMAAIALAVGLPVGVAAGRWAWTLFASRVGVIDESVVPVPAVLLVVPAAVLLANLLAAIPGRVAARVQPALALRSE